MVDFSDSRLFFWLETWLKKTFKDFILYLFLPFPHQIFRPSTTTTRTTLVKEMKVELWMQRRQFVFFFLFFSFCYAARCLNIRFLSEIGVCGLTLNLKYHSWLSWPKYPKVSIKRPVRPVLLNDLVWFFPRSFYLTISAISEKIFMNFTH